jgi:hypothetical protein
MRIGELVLLRAPVAPVEELARHRGWVMCVEQGRCRSLIDRLEGQAQDLSKLSIGNQRATRGLDSPDPLLSRLGDRAVTDLRLPQCLLSDHARAHIATVANDAADVGIVQAVGERLLSPVPATCSVDHPELDGVTAPGAGHDRVKTSLRSSKLIRVHEIPAVSSGDRGRVVAQQPAHCRRHVQQRPRCVHDEHPLASSERERLELCLSTSQR